MVEVVRPALPVYRGDGRCLLTWHAACRQIGIMRYGTFRWQDVLFVHAPVSADQLRARLPAGVTVARYRGQSWVSLVALAVEGPVPRALIGSPLSPLWRYQQLNLRTYVDGPAGPGMVLIETRLDRPSYVFGARLVGMPFRLDRALTLRRDGDELRLRARGLTLTGHVGDVPPATAAPGSLIAFLLERARVYSTLPGGRLLAVEIAHAPWRLRPVTLSTPPSLEPFGLHANGPLEAMLGEEVEVALVGAALPDGAVADDPALLSPA